MKLTTRKPAVRVRSNAFYLHHLSPRTRIKLEASGKRRRLSLSANIIRILDEYQDDAVPAAQAQPLTDAGAGKEQ